MPVSKKRKPKKGKRRPQPQPVATKVSQDSPSPTWYVATMSGLMAVGVLLVLVRFVFSLDQWVLLTGLILIAVGFLMTTNYK